MRGAGGGRHGSDRGAANLMVIPVVMGLVFVTLLLIRTLGSATADSREARTAADAAALGAVQAWSDSIESGFWSASGSSSHAGFWGFAGRSLASFASPDISAQAHYFAQRNGAEVTSVSVDPVAGAVTVSVRDTEEVPETGQRMEHTATAQLTFVSGACRSGSHVGYLIYGACRTTAPPTPTPSPTPTPTPTSTPSPTPTPTPTFAPPHGLGSFDVRAELVG
jgi:hypothetical protein